MQQNASDWILYFSDEMRYGLISNFRRSWSKVGERAVLPQQISYENKYLFSAVNPTSGKSFHLLGFPDMNSDIAYVFLTQLKEKHPNQHVFVVWDNAPTHRPVALKEIPGLSIIFLPSYSPELNPTERFFEEMRRKTANQIFKSIDKQEECITKAINEWMDDEARMRQLLGYEWIKDQCREVS